jgi:hypothetical protein
MRRLLQLALATVLVASAGGALAPPTALRSSAPLTPRHVRYRIDATLRSPSRIDGTVSLRLRNTSARPLRQAMLHLYLNAFSGPSTLFMRESDGELRLSRADRALPGSIRVTDVRQGDRRVPARLLEDGTVMRVDLATAVAPGEELALELRFASQLPLVFARTGHAGDFSMGAQWYPKPGVLLADGSWHCPPFHPNSEFFAEFGSFDVSLDVPRQALVGATGVRVDRTVVGERQRLRYRAEDVHDFAFAASPSLVEQTRTVDGVTLRYLAPPGRGQADRQLHFASEALRRLQSWLRPYPYAELTIVDVPTAALGAAAMEYPTLITVWTPWWAPRAARAFDEITVHELVHQYFQGIVASNEVAEPWLDEGVTSYVAGLLVDEIFGGDRSWLAFGPVSLGNRDKERLRVVGARRVWPVGWPAARFPTWGAYTTSVYARGALLLATVESFIGDTAMRRALASYVRRHGFRHPTTRELEAALLEEAAPSTRRTLRELLDGVLRRGEAPRYTMRCAGDEVVVERRGLALPVQLETEGASGARLHEWDGREARYTAMVPGLRRARLGPRGRLSLDRAPIEHACDTGMGRWRATARIAAIVQRALQLVGP